MKIKWCIYEFGINPLGKIRYVLVPSNPVVYFFWAAYKNFKNIFTPKPYNLTQYYVSLNEARLALKHKEAGK